MLPYHSSYAQVKTAAPTREHSLGEGSAPGQTVTTINGEFFSINLLCLTFFFFFLCGNRLKPFDLAASQGQGRWHRAEGGRRKEGRVVLWQHWIVGKIKCLV